MTYRFGPFELDVEGYRLTREGEVVQAEPRVLELLSYLVAHRGSLVDKEELVREVWGGAFVADASIARAVSEARAALGDTAEEQRWIATVYGRGYRFVGEADEVGDPPEGRSGEEPGKLSEGPPRTAALSPDPAGRESRASDRPVLLYVGMAGVGLGFLLVILMVVLGRTGPGEPSEPSAETPIRLAVLPFQHIGPDGERWFATGLTEEITTRLAAVDGLAVISRTSSRQYADASPRTVAEELGVSYVLEGGVRLEVGPSASLRRIRVTPQLIRAADDTHVWAEVYEREMGDIFSVQADIAEHVASVLDLRLTPGEIEDLEQAPTADMEAYASYLRGLEIEFRATSTEEHRMTAAMYERATELDDEFAPAFARLAVALRQIHMDFAENTEEEAEAALARARELAPGSLETLMAEGVLAHFSSDPDHERAAAAFQAALDRRPHSGRAREGLARVRRYQGRLDEAIDHFERALELDPRNSKAAFSVAMTYMAARRFPEADAAFERAIALEPDYGSLWAWRARLEVAWRGDIDSAWAILAQRPRGVEVPVHHRAYLALCAGRPEDVVRMAEETPVDELLRGGWLQGYATHAWAVTGRRDEVTELGERLLEFGEDLRRRFPRGHYPLALLANAHLFLGHGEAAAEHMERAYDRFSSMSRFQAPEILEALAIQEVRLGLEERAIARIAELLETDYSFPLTRERLRIEPWWDPLRGHPEFQALLQPGS